MFAPPEPWPERPRPDLALRHVLEPDIGWYRATIRSIGEAWLWFSPLVIPEAKLSALLRNPLLEVHALERDGEVVGIVELDRRVPGEVEISFFGVAAREIGTGAARILMNRTLALAFARWDAPGLAAHLQLRPPGRGAVLPALGICAVQVCDRSERRPPAHGASPRNRGAACRPDPADRVGHIGRGRILLRVSARRRSGRRRLRARLAPGRARRSPRSSRAPAPPRCIRPRPRRAVP